jgi:hypothetical protein
MNDTGKLAHWMIMQGFATGHGDTVAALLSELRWQIDEMRANLIRYEAIRSGNVYVEPNDDRVYLAADGQSQYTKTNAEFDAFINQWCIE